MTSPHAPIFGPTALILKPVLRVTEQNGWWLKGRMVKDPNVSVELSFEHHDKYTLRITPQVPITFLQLCLGSQTLFEFQLGKIISDTPLAAEHVYDLSAVLIGVTPTPVTDRPPDHVITMRNQIKNRGRTD